MTAFAPREAMTTAEPSEPLGSSAFGIHSIQAKSIGVCQPDGEAFSVICVFCGALNQK